MTARVTSRVEKWLQVSIVLLTTLGATLLGTTQGNMKAPVLLLFAGITSIIFTDRLRWFRLPPIVANLLMIVLAFYWLCVFFGSDAGVLELLQAVTSGSLAELLRGGTDSFQRLLAIASLLAFVQVIMLYQEKTLRIFGLATSQQRTKICAGLLKQQTHQSLSSVFHAATIP